MPRLKLSLYENTIDSIQHAIEHYTSDPDEHRRYKYAIQHLSQGVLLLLKERLRMEQPRFIYTNVAKETKTVDTDRAISQLKSIAGVDFGGRESVLRELISLRNAVEHYALDINKQQADSIIGRVVPIIAWFVETHLRRNFPRAIGEANWRALIRDIVKCCGSRPHGRRPSVG